MLAVTLECVVELAAANNVKMIEHPSEYGCAKKTASRGSEYIDERFFEEGDVHTLPMKSADFE